ncbi:GNAT family N-acetyltransferase [Rhizobium sp. AN80A]|uniref:GNAT family N-acetyltransferase n=1 Tax=Rhizobium sp. AN80A TaxID=3040673 RepID=UPI0024B34946|nr:GNAT family N-acetyltransferase [Rhizobium sp. AN80A]
MIRILGADDVEAFKRIRLEALRMEPAAFASSFEDWAELADEEWRRRLLADAVFLAFDGEEPVAIMGLIRQRASKMAHRATIVMVYVRRDKRGTGLARELLDHLVNHARQQGIRQLELTASAENPAAIGFYRNAGFVQAGLIPGGVMEGGREIDDVIMVRRITQ